MFRNCLSMVLFLLFICSANAHSGLRPSRYVKVNGIKIAVYESRGHRGPGVLLIHGNTSSANSYSKIMNSSFARTHHVVAMDLPGYGRSENAPFYDVGLFNSAIQKVATATGVDDGVIVGWSLGGDLALQASSLLPNAKGYFLFGTAPLGGAATTITPFLSPDESYAGMASVYGFVPGLTQPQINEYVRAFFKPQWYSIPNFFYQDGYRTDPGTRQAVANAAAGLDPNFQAEVLIVQDLQVPVALLHGKKDAFVRLEYLEAIAPTIPELWRGEIQVLPNTGHAIHWERPAKFISLLKKFIKDL